MGIMLGNLSIDDIEKKLDIIFPKKLKKIMTNKRQQDVSMKIKPGHWHCFHIPFVLVCGDKEFAAIITEHLKPLADNMSGSIRIAWQ